VRILQTTRGVAFKAALLAGGAGLAMLAAPAAAQDEDPEDVLAQPGAAEDQGIIVTGSRIVRRDFEANSPIVSVDEGLLQQSSTASLESNLNKLPQFAPAKTPTLGGDIQPTATNTPGAATISLRGIGANRSLVLIDGRRATPGNATGVVDINTIPSAAIERVEIISGGASATYGADAVAGVTNFILKKNFSGLELDGRAGLAEEGDAFEFSVSGLMGADFDDGRGNLSIAMSMNKREGSYQRDRDFYRDYWANPDVPGNGFFPPAPGVNFAGGAQPDYALVFPGATPAVPANTTVYFEPNGNAFTTAFPARGGVPFFGGATDGQPVKLTSAGTLAFNNTFLYNVLPLTRYNMLMRGNYEINDWIGVFASGMYSHTRTSTIQEPGPITGGWGVILDPTVISPALLPAELRTLLNSRADPNAPFVFTALMPEPRATNTDVNTYNLTAGFEGSIPGTDWTWEAFANFGESETFANQTGIYSLTRLRAIMTQPNFGQGFSATGNAAFGGFGASSATCTTGFNFFSSTPISDDCFQAIRADLKNRSKIQQNEWQANVTGSLFDTWAGSVQAAIGASYRETDFEFLNDTLTTQGTSFLDQALGIYPSGNSAGSINVKEVYGELLVPLLEDTLVQSLSLELGGRISDYNTTGTSYTYKALADLEVTDWLRFRGGYNRAERAPNIAELYLAPQQTFAGNTAGDPCSRLNPTSFSANPATNSANAAKVEAICRAQMAATGSPTAATEYYAAPQSNATFGFAFPTTKGNTNLVPEKADTWTAGVVISSPFDSAALSRLRLSVDYYSIKVMDAIGEQTIAIALQQCYDPALNPDFGGTPEQVAASQFCLNVPRNQAGGTLGNVQRTFVNNGRFKTSGIDAQLDWGIDIGGGSLNTNLIFNYLLDFKSAPLPTQPMVDYTGTFGTVENGLNAAAYEYRLLANVGYRMGPASLGVQWQHLPSVEDSSEVLIPGGTPTTGAPSYNIFALNGSYDVTDNMQVRFGVENLFDKAPPLTGINTANTAPATTGNIPGGTFNTQYYDTLGRRFYVGANLKF
jgi:iron complex outermembrane receptor protein